MLDKKQLENKMPIIFHDLENFFNSDVFPCLFAKASFNKGYMQFCLFKDIHDFKERAIIEIIKYRDMIEDLNSKQEKSYFTCLFIIENEETMINEIDFLFETLKFLHENDDQEWPYGKTKDLNSQDFEFYWKGTKLFPVVASPNHPAKIRVSPYLFIAIQPGKVFDYNKNERSCFYSKMRESIHKKISSIYPENKPYYLTLNSTGKNIYQFAGVDPTENNKNYIAPKL